MSVNSRPARLYVANRRAKPIVSTRRVERRSRPRRGQRGASPCRANWLRSRPWTKIASSRFWRRWASHSSSPGIFVESLPEAVLTRPGVEIGRGRRRGGARAAPNTGWPTHVGSWTPFVMAGIPCVAMPCQVALAVSAWSLLTALAPCVRRRLNAVMSNWPGSPSVPSPSSRTFSTGTPPASRSGPATRRTRSASKRSLPAETGVWIVNTAVRA